MGSWVISDDKKQSIVSDAKYYWRIKDQFDFIDSKWNLLGQPLGTWSGTVFSPKVPSIGIEIRNPHFVSLYSKLEGKTPSNEAGKAPNFLIYTKFYNLYNNNSYKLTIDTDNETFKIEK